ncbi:MAG: sensor histidine kinase N-terminal domain-containing protein [Candidatus Competibacteraceae bacterium]|nr:sensor histidine kinase N-terminal domain-containing protein [Candidatus Competibacteraceae bacterium]
MTSIRQRLLLGLLVGLSLVLGIAGYATYRQARAEVNTLFDYQLQQAALALRRQNLLALAIGSEAGEGEGDLLVQIWDRGGGLLYVSRRDWELPFATQPGFADLLWRDQRWRLFALYAGDRIVQVAQPARLRLRMSADIALRHLAPFLLLLPGMALVIWFGVGAGLRPLHRVATEIQQRRPGAVAERTRVFDRFYRGADANAPGSGLGLAIVQRVADRSRATVRLEDAEPGRGLRVIVRWPVIAG